MRPQSIVNFERVYLLMIVIGLVNAVLGWDALVAQGAAQGVDETVVIAIYALSLAISLLLLWLIARRRSNVTRWIYVILCAIGIAFTVPTIGAVAHLPASALALTVAQWLLTLLSIWFLFTAESRAWFAGRDEVAAP